MQLSGGGHVNSALITDGSIVNADVNASAAIAGSKLQALVVGTNAGVIPSTGITDAHVATGAAISAAKLLGSNVSYNATWSGVLSPASLNTIYNKFESLALADYDKVVGIGKETIAKLFFNVHLLFILWTGSTSGALTTDFPNWERTSEITITPGGAFASFGGTGAETLILNIPLNTSITPMQNFSQTGKIILDFWADFPATAAGDINIGFVNIEAGLSGLYDANTSGDTDRVVLGYDGTDGKIYAVTSTFGTGITTTEMTGITVTNKNNYRIELDLGVDAKFYVNGVLKATLSGANLCVINRDIDIGFGRSDTATFGVTAPNLAVEMNP